MNGRGGPTMSMKNGQRTTENRPSVFGKRLDRLSVVGLPFENPPPQAAYHFIKLISSTFTVLKLRYRPSTMAKPTAASAAATVMTKMAKTCP